MNQNVFRISSHKFHLTYKTHLDYESWIEYAKKNFGDITEYSLVHEIGDDSNNYLHTHIYVEFKEKVISKRQDVFNFKLENDDEYWSDEYWDKYRDEKNERIKGIHPNIQTVKNKEHRDNIVLVYHRKQGIPYSNILSEEERLYRETEEKKKDCKKCRKERYAKKHTCGMVDTEEKKEKKKIGLKELREKFEENPDFDAISFYAEDDIRTITAIQKALPYVKKPIGPEPKVLWRPWQMNILERLSKKCTNDRLILWVADPKGRSGKSKFTEHLEMFYDILFLQDLKLSTVGCRIRNAYEREGKVINTIIIDLPRGYNMQKEYYQTLEYLKSGKITSEKYDSAKINFTGSYNNPPHVIVFSNEIPDFTRLTPDKLGLLVVDKLGIKIVYENIIESPELKLPDGYQKPATVLTVAEPDEIIGDEIGFKKFNFNFTEKEKDESEKFWIEYQEKEDIAKKEEKMKERVGVAELLQTLLQEQYST